MQKFVNLFSSASERIIIANYQKYDVQPLLKESSLLITDYSSVHTDFAYTKKPVLYFYSTEYFPDAMMTPEAEAWYDRLIQENKSRRVYDQEKLEQRILIIKKSLVQNTLKSDMPVYKKYRVVFHSLPFLVGLKMIVKNTIRKNRSADRKIDEKKKITEECMGKRKTVYSNNKQNAAAQHIMLVCVFFFYLATVLWFTVGRRQAGYYPGGVGLFWSYRLWLSGRMDYGAAIIANIAMFAPFGFLVTAMDHGKLQKPLLRLFLFSLLFSSFIEALQYFLLRGCYEFDDVFNNVVGALLGMAMFRWIKRKLSEKLLSVALYFAGTAIMLCCLCVVLLLGNRVSGSLKPLSYGLCFQVEEAASDGGRLHLKGICFWYDQGPENYTLTLQSTRTGKRYPLQTKCGILRPEVNDYFHRDNIQAGFEASGEGIRADEEYEFILDFGFYRAIPTGVYLNPGESGPDAAQGTIHYIPNALYKPLNAEGTDLEKIVAEGVLFVYDPAYHVYVYWYGNKLYWIVEDGFHFDDDGITRLELELRTDEMEKVPKELWMAGGKYALLGVYFEHSELKGNLGQYRACSFELPTAYTILSITTGYYSNRWIWTKSFWPLFVFSR